MIDLDDPQVYKEIDPTDMAGRIGELSQQCREAWQSASSFPLPSDYASVEKVVILGMGGSAIGGDLMRTLALEQGRTVLVHRDYGLPPVVDDRTLIIASSYSGNTEETISSFNKALETPAKKVAIATGGKLKALAEESGVPVFTFRYVGEPRAAIGYSLFSLLAIFQRLGLTSVQPGDIDETIALLQELSPKLDSGVPVENNRAKQLAARLWDRLIVTYGAGILCSVSYRWKTQFNENSKAWAFSECLPELNHNAVVGYSLPPWLRDKTFVIMLRSPSLHSRILTRYEATAEMLADAGIAHDTIDAQGNSALSQIMSTILLGDYVSYYLAILNGVDPSPVKAIEGLKERLSSFR